MNKQEAIKRLKANRDMFVFEETKQALDIAIEALHQERPQGEWIVYPLVDNGRVELECPECGDTFIRAIDYRPHFCENCGAMMKGDEE